jgi:hypothetical protein
MPGLLVDYLIIRPVIALESTALEMHTGNPNRDVPLR